MNHHPHIMYCQSNGKGKSYLAVGVDNQLLLRNTTHAFDQLSNYLEQGTDWVFGYLSYDLKNDVESLSSNNHDGLKFPEMIFFRPLLVISFHDGKHTVEHHSGQYTQEEIDDLISKIMSPPEQKHTQIMVDIQSRTTKESYLQNTRAILDHIHRGDIYEMNYCHEFYVENIHLDPWHTYTQLNQMTRAPYASFMRWEDYHIMSGSPELFLQRRGNTITSKPIKGTIRRGESIAEDKRLKNLLKNDPKEVSENVMIVDLVRNDLSRTAIKNSVQVKELCAIYTFDTVHQMISTIVSEVAEDTPSLAVIKNAFPMGSMTGAPKISAMNLIEFHEDFKRGIYSGALGFFEPNGDFTFNVIIRSVLYNAKEKYCSMAAGGALTALSVPEKEYEETLLKANAMKKSLSINAK